MLTLLAVLQPCYVDLAARSVVARPAVQHAHRAGEVTMGAPLGGRRVVVTGMGIVSCLGNTLDDVRSFLVRRAPKIAHWLRWAQLVCRAAVLRVALSTSARSGVSGSGGGRRY